MRAKTIEPHERPNPLVLRDPRITLGSRSGASSPRGCWYRLVCLFGRLSCQRFHHAPGRWVETRTTPLAVAMLKRTSKPLLPRRDEKGGGRTSSWKRERWQTYGDSNAKRVSQAQWTGPTKVTGARFKNCATTIVAEFQRDCPRVPLMVGSRNGGWARVGSSI